MKLKKQHLEMHKMKSTIPELSWEVATSMWLWEKKMPSRMWLSGKDFSVTLTEAA